MSEPASKSDDAHAELRSKLRRMKAEINEVLKVLGPATPPRQPRGRCQKTLDWVLEQEKKGDGGDH